MEHVRLTNSMTSDFPRRAGRLMAWGILAVLLAGGLPEFLVPEIQAQTNKRNIFERSASPNRSPRPKADDETRQTLRHGLGRGFNTGFSSTGNAVIFLAMFLLLLLFLGGLVYYDMNYRQHSKQGLENPWVVFRELCHAHRLTWAEKKFLRKVADELDLDDPLPLFIEPRYWGAAMENRNLSDSQSTIDYFLRKLFDIRPGQEYAYRSQVNAGQSGVADFSLSYHETTHSGRKTAIDKVSPEPQTIQYRPKK